MNGRVVALDVGDKRIGVAACDPSGIVVRAVGVVQAEPQTQALAEIQRIVNAEEAVLILVGLPLTLRGEHGPQAQRVTAFADALRQVVAVPLVFRDERFTSVEAERIIEARGGKRKKNRRRGEVDEVAATLILQDYLTEQEFQRPRSYDDWGSDTLDHEV
ncbi:MAG: Holliday junction resolvase RuvX [Chloroflexota bacterium]|nr:Holliday junction resolvase RuvX [Chloroflexota bacterium]PLS80728.1 MAG: Holliday junction resolvase RuvX [Chloroflexota bacterium]